MDDNRLPNKIYITNLNILISCFCTDGKISVRINLPLFSTVVPSNICMFLSCWPFVVITTVDNVVITTKGLQDRNIHILDGMTVENKGKLILTYKPEGRKHIGRPLTR